jgi:dihydrofolate reductase
VPDDAQLRLAGLRRGCPRGEQIVEHRVQRLLWRVPRLEQVVVDVDDVDRIDRRLGIGVRGQQHPPSGWEQVHRRFQELDPVHLRHPVVGEHDRHRVTAQLHLAQRVQGRRAGLGAHHAVLVAVPPAQVARDGSRDGRVVVHRQDRRVRHIPIQPPAAGSVPLRGTSEESQDGTSGADGRLRLSRTGRHTAREPEGSVMPKLRVHNMSVSLDGYAAGPDQSVDNPLGVGGEQLHEWVFATPTGREMLGMDATDAAASLDDEMMKAGEANIGATIMGRNMFGPIRGDWPDESWTGWWGEDPPYHHQTFVLTHHPRSSVEMAGGTVFHFVTDGIEAALARAFDAAGGLDVRLGGGVATVQQYLRAGLLDEMHIAMVPVLLGSGERLLDNIAGSGLEVVSFAASPAAVHVHFGRPVVT